MDDMPKGGVDELLKSSDGRKHLEKLQERHKLDILQPTTPEGKPNEMFHKVWDKEIQAREDTKRKDEASAKAEWKEVNEKRAYETYRKGHVNRKYL